MMWGYGGYGFLWMGMFWIGVILLLVWSFRRTNDSEAGRRNRATEILDERFARGEIDADELDARRRELAR